MAGVSAVIGLSAILTGILLIFGERLLSLFGASKKTIGYAPAYISF